MMLTGNIYCENCDGIFSPTREALVKLKTDLYRASLPLATALNRAMMWLGL